LTTRRIAGSGYNGFDTSDWKVLVAPAGVPHDIIKLLNNEVVKAVSRPDTIAQLLQEGSVPMAGWPQQTAQYLKSERERWSKVARDSGPKVD
jgi:tripartite-type tricarboxylate transporter receptor subunit TctC